MRKDTYIEPKSSFLGMEKDTALIIERILKNQNLLKLFRYTDTDWRNKPDLSSEDIKELFNKKQISNIPKVLFDDVNRTFLRIGFDYFTLNGTNPQYRDHTLEFKIICHFDCWDLDNFELRPYRIAGELDAMFNGSKLTGIGEVIFVGANQDIYDNEYGGLTLRYLVTRGNEDKVMPLA